MSAARPIVLKAINQSLERLHEKISHYNIRPLILPYWTKLFQPIRIGDIGYLLINPSQVQLENLSGSAHLLTAGIGITARPEFSLVKPGTPSICPSLPDISSRSASGFNITMDIHIQYGPLNELINTYLVNKKIIVGKNGYLLVKNAELYGIGNNHLLIRTDFTGRQNGIGYKGHLYFTCLPAYDTSTGRMTLGDLDFDTHTREKLISKAGDWILQTTIKSFLHDQVHVDLGGQILSFKDQLTASLNKPIGLKMNLSGQINRLSLEGILPAKDCLLLRFNATGKVSIRND